MAGGLAVSGWFGFVAKGPNSTNTVDAISGLTYTVAWLPFVVVSLTLLIMYMFPLNDKKIRTIHRVLARRI